MAKSRHPTRAWLPARCVDAFRKLSDHILGSKIAGLRLANGLTPPWSTVPYNLVRTADADDLARWPGRMKTWND